VSDAEELDSSEKLKDLEEQEWQEELEESSLLERSEESEDLVLDPLFLLAQKELPDLLAESDSEDDASD
jgi:hypothetical protein